MSRHCKASYPSSRDHFALYWSDLTHIVENKGAVIMYLFRNFNKTCEIAAAALIIQQ